MPRTQSVRREPPARNEERGLVQTQSEREQKVMTDVVTMVAKRREQLEALLSGQMDIERFTTVALQAVQNTPRLLQCTPLSIFAAIREAAIWGVELGPMGDATLVPYADQAQLSVEYRGLRKLALRDGTVAICDADLVYENDDFELELGEHPRLRHRPALADRGNPKLAYAFARFANGQITVIWMDLAQLMKRRDQSRSWRYAEENGKNDSMWHRWPDEMMKKTVLRRLIMERLPLTPVVREALTRDLEADVERPEPKPMPPVASAQTRQRLLSRMGIGEEQGQIGAGERPTAQAPEGAAARPVEPSEADGVQGESQPARTPPAPRSTRPGAGDAGTDPRESGTPHPAPAPPPDPTAWRRGEAPALGHSGEPSGPDSSSFAGSPRASRARPSPAPSQPTGRSWTCATLTRSGPLRRPRAPSGQTSPRSTPTRSAVLPHHPRWTSQPACICAIPPHSNRIRHRANDGSGTW